MPNPHFRKKKKSHVSKEIASLEAVAAEAEKEARESAESGQPDTRPIVELSEVRAMPIFDLVAAAEKAGVENAQRLRKQDLLFGYLKARAKNGERIHGEGVLEVINEGYGFLRYPDQSYVAGPGDIYVSPNMIRRIHLNTGDTIAGEIRTPKDNERYFALVRPDSVNSDPAAAEPGRMRHKVLFENLTPLFPTEQMRLERPIRAEENITSRVVDIIAPVGKGQRGLLVASPKSGKTVILQHIAHAIEENHPDVAMMVLLIDERPEEVTEMRRSVRGEVVFSTFDESATRHIQVAEMVIEKAKRLVEMRKDVVILLDSITRLARAYNTAAPVSGRILTGGVDSQALQRPKRFFGAARNIEEGGSLTIIATALVETGSRMDEVIYEEFKGTGNMEIHLDRRLAERRVYPSIIIGRSSTRREDLLMEPATLNNVWALRKALATLDNEEKAIELVLDRMRQTKSNEEFFSVMKKGG